MKIKELLTVITQFEKIRIVEYHNGTKKHIQMFFGKAKDVYPHLHEREIFYIGAVSNHIIIFLKN